MMGQQARSGSLFYYFRLEDQIPEDHPLRRIRTILAECGIWRGPFTLCHDPACFG
jgi:hypothetical protein